MYLVLLTRRNYDKKSLISVEGTIIFRIYFPRIGAWPKRRTDDAMTGRRPDHEEGRRIIHTNNHLKPEARKSKIFAIRWHDDGEIPPCSATINRSNIHDRKLVFAASPLWKFFLMPNYEQNCKIFSKDYCSLHPALACAYH